MLTAEKFALEMDQSGDTPDWITYCCANRGIPRRDVTNGETDPAAWRCVYQHPRAPSRGEPIQMLAWMVLFRFGGRLDTTLFPHITWRAWYSIRCPLLPFECVLDPCKEVRFTKLFRLTSLVRSARVLWKVEGSDILDILQERPDSEKKYIPSWIQDIWITTLPGLTRRWLKCPPCVLHSFPHPQLSLILVEPGACLSPCPTPQAVFRHCSFCVRKSLKTVILASRKSKKNSMFCSSHPREGPRIQEGRGLSDSRVKNLGSRKVQWHLNNISYFVLWTCGFNACFIFEANWKVHKKSSLPMCHLTRQQIPFILCSAENPNRRNGTWTGPDPSEREGRGTSTQKCSTCETNTSATKQERYICSGGGGGHPGPAPTGPPGGVGGVSGWRCWVLC